MDSLISFVFETNSDNLETTECWRTLEGIKTTKCTHANGGVMHRPNPLKSGVRAK